MGPWRLAPASLIIACVSMCFLGGGCSSPQERSLCQQTLTNPEQEEEEEDRDDDEGQITIIRPVTPEEWLQLIVNSRDGQRAVQECTGTAIRPAEPSEACREAQEEERRENPDYEEEPPPVPVELTDESVIERRVSKSQRLVWIITHEYENGDAFGPIALVKREDTEEDGTILRVTALGALRSRKLRVRLRLETIQVPEMFTVYGEDCPDEDDDDAGGADSDSDGEEEDGEECEQSQFLVRSSGITCRNQNRPETCHFERRYRRRMEDYLRCVDIDRPETCYTERQILIAEGETCEDPEDIATCSRAAQFMFRRGDRFYPVELHHVNGDCMGRAQMVFSDTAEVALPGGWQRDFTLTTSFEIDDSGFLLLHEQVVAIDSDPRRAEEPPRPFREANTDVRWYPFESRFVTATPSLWNRMLEEAASLQLPPESSE